MALLLSRTCSACFPWVRLARHSSAYASSAECCGRWHGQRDARAESRHFRHCDLRGDDDRTILPHATHEPPVLMALATDRGMQRTSNFATNLACTADPTPKLGGLPPSTGKRFRRNRRACVRLTIKAAAWGCTTQEGSEWRLPTRCIHGQKATSPPSANVQYSTVPHGTARLMVRTD